MSAAVDCLDHVGIVVRDLDRAARSYAAMGFQLTPLARQSGPVRPGEPPQPWGSANRCVMLRQGYIEILSLLDPALYDNQLKGFLARHEGIHVLALGINDAPRHVERLRAAGFAGIDLKPLQRPAATPAGERLARFQRVPLPPDAAPEGRVQLVEHLTPELLWQPHLLDHPNRGVALVETVLAVDDVDEAASRYERLSGPRASHDGACRVFAFPRGRLVIAPASGSVQVPRDGIHLTPPAFVRYTVATDDGNQALERCLASAGLPHRRESGRIVIGPEHAGGAQLTFVSQLQPGVADSLPRLRDCSLGGFLAEQHR